VVIRWLALIVAVVTLCLASWIVLPGPTYFLLTFSVGAPEVSAWLIVSSLVALGLAAAGMRTPPVSHVAQVAAACAVVSLLLAISPFVRLPSALRRFDFEAAPLSSQPARPLRTKRMSILDLFRGIPTGEARTTRGIRFENASRAPLTLDVYQPAERGKYPVVVQIYGGAWQRGEPAANADFAKWLAAGGYVVVAVDYRHAPAARWPAQLTDVLSSLAWVRDHAAEFDGDTSRVVLIGRSAGGHLALMAAYSERPLNLRGVISYYGPTDLAESYRHPPSPDPLHNRAVEEALLGGPLDAMADRYAAASPVTYARRGLPPTLLIYGSRDHTVEPKYGRALRDQLAPVGTPVVYLEIPWADHAFDAVFNGVSSQVALYYTERFLAHVTR
jgi:acetyl esterase/lipase